MYCTGAKKGGTDCTAQPSPAAEEMDEKLDKEHIDVARAGNVQKLRELFDKGVNIEATDKVRVGGAGSCVYLPPD